MYYVVLPLAVLYFVVTVGHTWDIMYEIMPPAVLVASGIRNVQASSI